MNKIKRILMAPVAALGWGVRKIFGPLLKSGNTKVKNRWTVILLLVVGVMVGFYLYPTGYNQTTDWLNQRLGWNIKPADEQVFKLGLDLQGGTQLIYQGDFSAVPSSDQADSLEGVRDVIERRVNAFGIAEPLVQISGEDRLLVELPGIKDVTEAIHQIGETPLLEFKESMTEEDKVLSEDQQTELDKYNNDVKLRAQSVLDDIKGGADFVEQVKNFSEQSVTKERDGLVDYAPADQLGEDIVTLFDGLQPGALVDELYDNSSSYEILKYEGSREDNEEIEVSHILVCYEGTSNCTETITKDEALAKINEIKAKATAENFADLAKEYSTGPSGPKGGYLGWSTTGMYVPPFEKAMLSLTNGSISDVVETDFGYHLIYRSKSRPLTEYSYRKIVFNKRDKNYYFPGGQDWKYSGLSGTQLDRAQVQFDQKTGESQVALEFNSEGADLFKEITERNIGKPVAIFLDGTPISIPTVNDVILDGRAVITGRFTIEEAKELSKRLNAGALPIPSTLIGQRTVGATLGNESVQRSLWAGLVGLILVCIYMVIIYRVPGLMAVGALALYGLFTLGIFKFVGVTLTLSGIAGFILSIGMAVDANVLIFERLREEIKRGKTISAAIDIGFKRAWPSIRDGNISTIITCLILAWFGTSIVQGFAITLILGIVVSMFSAIVITKTLLSTLIPDRLLKYKILF